MPSDKSFRASQRKASSNRLARSTARSAVVVARRAIEEGDAQKAQAATIRAASALDRAAKRGAVHRNNASRRKSRLDRGAGPITQQAT